MINFKEYLTEGRDAPLYHGTSIKDLKSILGSDVLFDNSSHFIKYGTNIKGVENFPPVKNVFDDNEWDERLKQVGAMKRKQITLNKKDEKTYLAKYDGESDVSWTSIIEKLKGVCLSRSLKFATKWAVEEKIPDNPIVLELNQAALARRYKIIPVNYSSLTGKAYLPNSVARDSAVEFEEFVAGAIKPLSKYLIKIIIPTEASYYEILELMKTNSIFADTAFYYKGKRVNANI